MKITQLAVTLAALISGAAPVGAVDIFSFNNLNAVIPDGQPAGYSDVGNISSSISQIGSIQVSLNFTGNFNGDLYCYLQHDGGLSVLLNRSGRTSSNSFGYDDGGFNITLSDSAANGDIHTYRNAISPPAGSLITGLWQPDGRAINPTNVLDTDLRLAPLSVFNGMDPSGTWTLFVADMSSGGNSLLNGWQLIVVPVPEPTSLAVLATGAGCVAFLRRRRKS